MTRLTSSEMYQVQGGGWCGTLRAVTLISCRAAFLGTIAWTACGIGIVGGVAVC